MANERILVIDDVRIVFAAFKLELEPEGYQLDHAISGKEGLEMMRSKKYDLIFVDQIMPGMNGVETCRAIIEAAPDSKVVFMTGKIHEDLIKVEMDFVDAGGKIYYLYKPFGKGELLEVTRKALKSHD